MELTILRSIAGGSLAFVVAIGAWTGSRLTRDTAMEVETLLATEVDAKTAQKQAMASKAQYKESPAYYKTRVDAAVEAFGIEPPNMDRLRAPNPFHHPINMSDPKRIEPGQARREGPLSIAVRAEQRTIERGGMRTKNMHTYARVLNTAKVPVAYRLLMRKAEAGECQLRNVNRYDAVVLDPGERIDISICSGKQAVEVLDLRMLEITGIGATWVDKIPAQALALDPTSVKAHDPGEDVQPCTSLPAAELAKSIERGEFAWEDLVDYYSRHDCEEYRFWSDYRRLEAPAEGLPLLDPKAAAGDAAAG